MHFFKLPFILFRYCIRSPSDDAPALPENAGKSLLYALFLKRSGVFRQKSLIPPPIFLILLPFSVLK